MRSWVFLAVLVLLSSLIFVYPLFPEKGSEIDSINVTLNATVDGETLSYSQFRDITQDVVFFTDYRWRHVNGSLEKVYSKKFGGYLPGVVVPKNSTMNFLWKVPGFGRTVLRLDMSRFENRKTVNVNKGLAIQKYRTLRDEYKSYKGDKLRKVGNYVSRSGQSLRADNFLESLNQSLWGLELFSIQRAREQIEKERKKVYSIKVLDSKGNPVDNATVRYRLKERNFQLGWFEPDVTPRFSERVESLGLNTHMQFSFWHDTEPRNNTWNFEEVRNRISETERFDQGIAGMIGDSPKYLSKLPYSTLQKEVKEHTERTLKVLNPMGVDIWECYGLGMRYMADQSLQMTVNRSKEQNIRITETCIDTIKARTNDTVVVTGWNIDGSEIRNGSYDDVPYTYYRKLDGRNFSVGFDFMYFGGAHEIYTGMVEKKVYRKEAIGDTSKNWIPMHHLYTVSKMLDWYSSLNRTVYIQYFQAPSNHLEGQQGYWHEPWNERVQADWIKKYYTLAYSKPYVGGINYLELKDSKWKDFKTGIFYRNGTPKRSYHKLKELIDSWGSEGTVSTGPNGTATFRGYEGSYKVSVSSDNRTRNMTLRNTKGSIILD
ncbi:MAG: hypothetical protein ABEJ72_08025 [Candidatus Aenigmatarchaeota archaeon]